MDMATKCSHFICKAWVNHNWQSIASKSVWMFTFSPIKHSNYVPSVVLFRWVHAQQNKILKDQSQTKRLSTHRSSGFGLWHLYAHLSCTIDIPQQFGCIPQRFWCTVTYATSNSRQMYDINANSCNSPPTNAHILLSAHQVQFIVSTTC